MAAKVKLADDSLRSFVLDDLIFLREQGITYYSYGIAKASYGVIGFFSDQKWAEKYISNSLFKSDPLLIGATRLKNIVIPWECIPITSSYQFNVMDERYRTCSINSGMTFAREKDGLFEIIAVGTEQKADWDIFVEHKKNIEFMTEKLKFFLERALLWKK